MAEYVSGEPMAVDVGDQITFENKTDDNFSVDVGIVFRKSGLYRVSVVGKHTSVKIELERERGKWICTGGEDENGNLYYNCSVCGSGDLHSKSVNVSYCWNCGADMRGEQDGKID